MLPSVWPLPRSLATTSGLSVDVFSSPYLDVSVQAVPYILLFDSQHVDAVLPHRVSRVRRYSGYSWLPSLFAYETITLYGVPSHALLLRYRNAVYCPYPEDIATFGLASSVFARHYLQNLG